MKSLSSFRKHRKARVVLTAAAVVATAVVTPVIGRLATADAAISANYADALSKAVWFYDAQRLGKLPATNRVSWRGDSFLTDGADAGLDLVGGFADAGDTIKATFPLAHTLTTLAWSYVDNSAGYSAAGQSNHLLSNLRWGMDWMIKAHPSANKLVVEVGDPNEDHKLWAAAELQTYPRKTYFIDSSCGGSEVAASSAAAFASASLAFKASDPTYAATLLTHAKQLYTFADTVRGKYTNCVPVMSAFYDSWSGYYDELTWGALWLYQATGDSSYLTKAKSLYTSLPKTGQSSSDPIAYAGTYDWDDKTQASIFLLAKLTREQTYIDAANRWADWLTGPNGYNGAKATYSPGGQVFHGAWGSNRYAANSAMLALAYADSGVFDATRATRMHDFAVRQVNYVLGDNPLSLSYLIGYGSKYIQMPHHRGAHGPWGNNPDQDPVNNRHILYGAVVGGPTSANDQYGTEKRSDFQKSEVAIDYNAGMTGALARLTKEYGGTPSAIPTETPDGPEMYVLASLNQVGTGTGTSFFEIKALLQNKSAWPARPLKNGSYRYYFTLDPGYSASQVSVTSAYSQCPTAPTISQYSGNIYYVTINCTGVTIAPTGQPDFTKETQFRVIFPGPHDHTRDWSWAGVSTTQSSPALAGNIQVFDGTTAVYGNAPGTTPTSAAPTTVVPTTTRPTTAPPTSVVPTTSQPTTAVPTTAVPTTAGPTTAAPTTTRPTTGAPTSGPSATCKVTYSTNDWGSGFTAAVTVANTGTAAISNWTLKFSFSGNQQVTQGWSATWSQSGTAVTATNLSWNGSLAPGASTSIGFNGSYSGSNAKPTSFTLNGSACSLG
ncbi:glycoside hydrolase family 9 protein [Luedemannella helvata]